jgi:hypothetical protein
VKRTVHDGRSSSALAETNSASAQWVLVSFGKPDDPWAWSGAPESIARALRRAGQTVVRVSAELPASIDKVAPKLVRRVPGLSAAGEDFGGLVVLRNARLRMLDVDWQRSRVVAFGSTFWPLFLGDGMGGPIRT